MLPVLVGGKQLALNMNAEKKLFCIIEAFNMYSIIKVVRESFHRIEQDPENYENRKTGNELTGRKRKIIEGVEENY